MYGNLSSAEVNSVFESLARHRGVPFPGRLHDARQGFIIENYTRTETQRFLDEFRRRQQHGEPLVRLARIGESQPE